jgi:preprotein translocase subunit SecG
MEAVILAVHLMIAAALVGLVLVQKSEGGALGIGGGGGFMPGRGSGNTMTRITAYVAAAFFATSIVLTLLAQNKGQGRSAFDRAPQTPGQSAPATPGTPAPETPPKAGEPATTAPATPPAAPQPSGGILDRLKQQQPGAPRLPQGQ